MFLMSVAMSATGANSANGELIYKETCSVCHDDGSGRAPRISIRDDWAPRWQRGRAAMHEAAIKGVPDSAMVAKGGFARLSDDEVKAAVDYILARTGYDERLVKKIAAPAAPLPVARPRAGGAPVDDVTLQTRVAQTLRDTMAAGAQIENVEGKTLVRGVNIRVSVREGVVALEGTPEKPDVIKRAGQIAGAVDGVKRVDNKLVAAGLFDWD